MNYLTSYGTFVPSKDTQGSFPTRFSDLILQIFWTKYYFPKTIFLKR